MVQFTSSVLTERHVNVSSDRHCVKMLKRMGGELRE